MTGGRGMAELKGAFTTPHRHPVCARDIRREKEESVAAGVQQCTCVYDKSRNLQKFSHTFSAEKVKMSQPHFR